MVIEKNCTFNESGYDDLFNEFTKFQMSDFQKWACKAIVDGNHALITAPTGSGKTLPAEFMIHHLHKKDSKRNKIIYASPIKALSNQKLHDMRKRFPNITIGLLTGDCKENPDADVLIMTTEILRNTLFNRQLKNSLTTPGDIPLSFDINIETELAGVIFDEVHYIADPERGSVWEQALMMIPPHVPLLLLSATIHSPEKFAKWIENRHGSQSTLQTYLLPTSNRIVPLTHYTWTGIPNNIISKIYDKKIKSEAESISNKLAIIKDSSGCFIDKTYCQTNKISNYLHQNYLIPKRQFILNSLLSYLKDNNLLPALCFIFSRKQVEKAAKEITINLHNDNGLMTNTVEQECRNILASKLPNYKEYINLPEYKNIISLLEKGIAIHHAGLITVFREMVEILFDKGYIKLLFATETFAVGINMPTKTVIFTSLDKFDGNGNRYLLPHEYSQMSGRAGRRGIDIRGNVIHCSTLFETPSLIDYKHILTGPSQSISSTFRISYNFILNVLLPTKIDKCKIIEFVAGSLLNEDIKNELEIINIRENKLKTTLQSQQDYIKLLKTNVDTSETYLKLIESISNAKNKAKKKLTKEKLDMESDYPSIVDDSLQLKNIYELRNTINDTMSYKENVIQYISTSIDNIISLLCEIDTTIVSPEGIITVLIPGIIASRIQEVNAIALSLLMIECDSFDKLNSQEICSLIASLVFVNVPSEQRLNQPNSNSTLLNEYTIKLQNILNKIASLETSYQIDSGENYDIQFDIQQNIMDWYLANNDIECQEILNDLSNNGISTGDFIKAILKICNAAKELQDATDILGYYAISEKLAEIPSNIMKYVVTNQSLYI